MSDIAELIGQAAWLRNRIAQIRIDYPEAAEARQNELAQVEAAIALLRSPPEPEK